ncbi:SAF domain-containing protein [Paenibacillus herberti]|uniref:SAF domain-containing protein n=1 Tax=Paenibacillus herberti TaxID=1619309 RepID=A0A229NZY5_9BACL|nr:SAF domain-containing protein [Paenibacillus herberti]OXM15542.1 hypothetical protein CGZ75_02045 [Paenibacillus herberti]
MAVRKSKKIKKIALLTGSLTVILTSGVWFASYRYYNAQLIEERVAYERQLAEQKEELARYMDQSRVAYVLLSPKAAGEEIGEEDIREEQIPEFSTPLNAVTDPSLLIGKFLKIAAEPGTTLTAAMIRDMPVLDASERKEETEYIKLPLRLAQDSVVDIRIVFPNGEDYIVVGKKKLEDVDMANQYTFFNGSEEESLLLQAALVDAYVNKAELYMKEYVEPELQPAPIITYLPNKDVLKVIDKNPLIVDQAKWALAGELRAGLEDRLKKSEGDGQIRVGAEAPAGSGVSRRKASGGATEAPGASGSSSSTGGSIDSSNQAPVDSTADKPPATQSEATGDSEVPDDSNLLGGE